jgi:hypothetical protein
MGVMGELTCKSCGRSEKTPMNLFSPTMCRNSVISIDLRSMRCMLEMDSVSSLWACEGRKYDAHTPMLSTTRVSKNLKKEKKLRRANCLRGRTDFSGSPCPKPANRAW